MRQHKLLPFLVALTLSCSFSTVWAQSDVTYPKIPLDTLSTGREAMIIIYADNSWSYYFPNYGELSMAEPFRDHWNTEGLFAYRGEPATAIPETMQFELINTIDDFKVPYKGKVWSKYGVRGSRRKHDGVDISLHKGEPVYAAFSGKVRYASYNSGGYGNLVIIRHPNGLETWYAHLSSLNVYVNEYVMSGAVIGLGGSTGRSRGPHLHFEVRYHDLTFDPEFIIDFEEGALRFQTFVLEKSYFDVHSNANEILADDDDAFDSNLLASNDGTQITSEEIVSNIENAEAEKARAKAAAEAKAKEAVYHTIKNGDTLGGLAVKYHTTVSKLCKLNSGLTSKTTLKLGRKVRVR